MQCNSKTSRGNAPEMNFADLEKSCNTSERVRAVGNSNGTNTILHFWRVHHFVFCFPVVSCVSRCACCLCSCVVSVFLVGGVCPVV